MGDILVEVVHILAWEPEAAENIAAVVADSYPQAFWASFLQKEELHQIWVGLVEHT